MQYIETIAQVFGIFGLIFSALSYQEKNNKKFFFKQGIAGLMFFTNFILMGVFSAAFFNLVNLVRGSLLSKNDHKLWRLIVILALYAACFAFSLVLIYGDAFQVFLSIITFLTLEFMTVLMWFDNGKHIRYGQLFFSSPVWLFHNIVNFSLGAILCEVFMMASVIISFIRFGKDGFEK